MTGEKETEFVKVHDLEHLRFVRAGASKRSQFEKRLSQNETTFCTKRGTLI